MFTMKRLVRADNDKLQDLYNIANVINGDDNWADIDKFFEELGKKYNFDPKDVYINTNGRIFKITICYKCGGVANTQAGVTRVTEGNKTYPICFSCYNLYYKGGKNGTD